MLHTFSKKLMAKSHNATVPLTSWRDFSSCGATVSDCDADDDNVEPSDEMADAVRCGSANGSTLLVTLPALLIDDNNLSADVESDLFASCRSTLK